MIKQKREAEEDDIYIQGFEITHMDKIAATAAAAGIILSIVLLIYPLANSNKIAYIISIFSFSSVFWNHYALTFCGGMKLH